MNRATLNKTKWEGKQLAMTASHPHIRKLPFPVQRLIGREARLAVGLEQLKQTLSPESQAAVEESQRVHRSQRPPEIHAVDKGRSSSEDVPEHDPAFDLPELEFIQRRPGVPG